MCSRWEGLPNVVLEALAHGRPVVATDVGDTGKLIRDGSWGWLVPPDDARSFAEALTKLVATPRDELNAMGRAGSSFVLSEYSVERLVERTMIVYRHV
ncbi:glycosyltransferase family 4 protein, partial [bacterium]|nr:glycosyltransferase family 4 protein [bacterium]